MNNKRLDDIFTSTTTEDFRLKYISELDSGEDKFQFFKKVEYTLGRKLNVVFSLSGKIRNSELSLPFYKTAIEEIKRRNLFNLIVVGVTDMFTIDNREFKQTSNQSQNTRQWLTEEETITYFKEEIDFDYFKILEDPLMSCINKEYVERRNRPDHHLYGLQQQFIKFDESIKMVTQPVDIIFRTRWDLVFNPELFVDYFINNVLLTMHYMSRNSSIVYNGNNDIAVTLSDSPFMHNLEDFKRSKGDITLKWQDWNFFCSGAAYRSFSENLSEAVYYGLGTANLKFKEMFGFDCYFMSERYGYMWLYGLVSVAGENSMMMGTILPVELVYLRTPFKKLLRGDHEIYHDPRWRDDGSLFSFYYLVGWNLGLCNP